MELDDNDDLGVPEGRDGILKDFPACGNCAHRRAADMPKGSSAKFGYCTLHSRYAADTARCSSYQRKVLESLEEYLARGGTVTKVSPNVKTWGPDGPGVAWNGREKRKKRS